MLIVMSGMLYSEPHLFINEYLAHRRAFTINMHSQTLVNIMVTTIMYQMTTESHFLPFSV